ncbi:TetR/AcrR family transcriptional regulator [Streptomyces sp. TRM 70351]|uniref:TetR/AcrR family transcriptional regulator n=1 Tax=Streptomyces sp. TRM 70351 TaxID=3116552 RepID=UPI002E7BC83C|nr:TetR/AcrR family transcriptional regulator [Streptomyces sp. TRM 70351]MEE1926699.1 TetR/AcrR family transcriptional regulator [Streptomyces sp. TRM 70351]
MSEPPESETPPPRSPKGERTRARILDSATELFSRSGFHAVSLRDIAAHAGLTHAGLLHHFPGKDSLLIEVLGRRDRTDAQAVFPGITHPGAPEPGPDERLRRLVGLVVRNSRTPGLVALYAKLSAEATDPGHPAHHYFRERYRVLREELTVLVEALQAASRPPVQGDPAVTARQLLALMDGLQTQWLLEPDAVVMEDLVTDFLHRLGLGPAAGAEGGGVSP